VGHYSLTVIEGEDALDPASPATGRVYELPNAKLAVAFWFSPDSTKVPFATPSCSPLSPIFIASSRALSPALSPCSHTRADTDAPTTTGNVQVLLMTAAGKSREDVVNQKAEFRVGLNSDMQWAVYNFPLQELREYDTFKPTPYFMKVRMCLARSLPSTTPRLLLTAYPTRPRRTHGRGDRGRHGCRRTCHFSRSTRRCTTPGPRTAARSCT